MSFPIDADKITKQEMATGGGLQGPEGSSAAPLSKRVVNLVFVFFSGCERGLPR